MIVPVQPVWRHFSGPSAGGRGAGTSGAGAGGGLGAALAGGLPQTSQ
jgi:hypothetical protein